MSSAKLAEAPTSQGDSLFNFYHTLFRGPLEPVTWLAERLIEDLVKIVEPIESIREISV